MHHICLLVNFVCRWCWAVCVRRLSLHNKMFALYDSTKHRCVSFMFCFTLSPLNNFMFLVYFPMLVTSCVITLSLSFYLASFHSTVPVFLVEFSCGHWIFASVYFRFLCLGWTNFGFDPCLIYYLFLLINKSLNWLVLSSASGSKHCQF